MSVEVRPAIVADVPALLDLYAQLSEGFGDGPELSVAEGEAIFRGIAAQPDRPAAEHIRGRPFDQAVDDQGGGDGHQTPLGVARSIS